MAAGAVGVFGAGEHAGDLFDATATVEFGNTHCRSTRDDCFFHEQVTIGKAGDLRLVRNAEDLICFRQLLQLYTHSFADAAADPGVDFVEDDRAGKLRSVYYSLQ